MPALEEFDPRIQAAQLQLVLEAGGIGDFESDERARLGELGVGLTGLLAGLAIEGFHRLLVVGRQQTGDDDPADEQPFLDRAQIPSCERAIGRHIGVVDIGDQGFDLACASGVDPGNGAHQQHQHQRNAEHLEPDADLQPGVPPRIGPFVALIQQNQAGGARPAPGQIPPSLISRAPGPNHPAP